MASLIKSLGRIFTVAPSKNASYFKQQNVLENTLELQRVLKAAPSLPDLKTTTEITFNTIPLVDITSSKIKNKFGIPSYVQDNSNNIEGHEVYFYLDSIDNYKFLVQYHFFNNNIFFVSNKISSTGKKLSDRDKSKIVGRISQKYLNDKPKDTKRWLIKVSDPNNSIIYTVDEVYYQLYYLAGNDTTKHLIDKYINNYQPEAKPEGFNESIDSYI